MNEELTQNLLSDLNYNFVYENQARWSSFNRIEMYMVLINTMHLIISKLI